MEQTHHNTNTSAPAPIPAPSKYLWGIWLMLLAAYIEGATSGPADWVMKYDLSGEPASMASRSTFFAIHLFFVFGVNLSIYFVRRYVGYDPELTHVNIPFKEYWMSARHREEGLRRVNSLLTTVLIFVNAVAFIVFMLSRLSLPGVTVNLIALAIVLCAIYLIYHVYQLFKPRPEDSAT